MTELEKLEQGLAVLEAQRAVLGEAVVEAMLAPIREKLAALRGAATIPPPAPPPTAPTPQPQRKLVTILFADLSGFTTLSETMDAEDVTDTMNRVWQRLDRLITAHGGYIDKHIGDAIMALWGAQTTQEDDAERAIHAALALQKELAAIRISNQRADASLHMRVGINTGVALLGEVGTTGEFTAIGDAVNLAQRLEQATPIGGILISHDTFRHVRGVFNVTPQTPLRVKGKTEIIQTYLVNSAKPRAFRMATRGVEGIETPMVGRASELAALQAAYTRAFRENQNRTQFVTIVGEAGMGKSRLLYEFSKWLEFTPEPFWFFRARATPTMMHLPYALFRDLLADRFEILESDTVTVVWEKLEKGLTQFMNWDQSGLMRVHLIGQLLGFDFSASPYVQALRNSPQHFADRALAYLLEFFAVAGTPTTSSTGSVTHGMVVLVEDIHWADEKSLTLLNHLVQECPHLNLLIICLTRPAFFERYPTWGTGLDTYQQLTLHPLTAEDSQQLVSEILRHVRALPEHLRDLITRHAEGNPFYVEELIKMLIDDGVIRKGEHEWDVETERLADLRVPPTLTGIVQARLDSLPAGERAVLQKASVVGRIFWDAAIANLNDDATTMDMRWPVEAALEHLRQRELIFRREDTAFDHTREYIFKHALLRDATYESVLKRVRRVYHLQAAHWLSTAAQQSQRESEFLGVIGEHFERAGEIEHGVAYLHRAGEQASLISAFQDAQNFYERALALLALPESAAWPPAAEWRAQLLRRLGEAHWHVGNFKLAKEHLTESVTQARPLANQLIYTEAVLRLGRLLYDEGDTVAAEAHLTTGLAAAQALNATASQAYALNNLGHLAEGRGDYAQARELYLKSLALRQTLGQPIDLAATLNSLGNVAMSTGLYAEAKEHYQASSQLYQSAGYRYGMAIPLSNLGEVALYEKNFLQAREYFQASLAISKEIGNKYGLVFGYGNLGRVAIELNEDAEAERLIRDALQLGLDIGALRHALADMCALAQLWARQGRWQAATELLGFITQHPAYDDETRKEAETLLERLRVQVPAATLLAWGESGQAKTLADIRAILRV